MIRFLCPLDFYVCVTVYVYITVHHVPKCMSCNKAIVVITGKTHCFHDCMGIAPILLISGLSSLCVVGVLDHLSSIIHIYIYNIYIYIYILVLYFVYCVYSIFSSILYTLKIEDCDNAHETITSYNLFVVYSSTIYHHLLMYIACPW